MDEIGKYIPSLNALVPSSLLMEWVGKESQTNCTGLTTQLYLRWLQTAWVQMAPDPFYGAYLKEFFYDLLVYKAGFGLVGQQLCPKVGCIKPVEPGDKTCHPEYFSWLYVYKYLKEVEGDDACYDPDNLCEYPIPPALLDPVFAKGFVDMLNVFGCPDDLFEKLVPSWVEY